MAAASPEEFTTLFKEQQLFSVDLYKEMCEDNENLVLCPTSVFAALCMLGAGAKGNTAAQLTEALNLPSIEADSEVHESFRKLVKDFNSVNPGDVEITIDTTLFLAIGYSLTEVFAKTLSVNYRASVHYVNFQNKQEAANDINTWIAKETKDKIKNMVNADLLKENTRLVLANAVYLKGFWDSKFMPENTIPDYFHLLDGSVRQVDMMHQEGSFRCDYSDKLHSRILEMPYKGLEFSMDIILPVTSNAFRILEKSLDVNWIETLLMTSKTMPTTVDVWLPRFQAEVSASLHEVLPKLGIVDMFCSEKADLSGISGESLFVSVMLHKTFIVVDEKGSEAAAATIAQVHGFSESMPFRVNRPFLYFIRHIKSGAILFIGRMTSPPESSSLLRS